MSYTHSYPNLEPSTKKTKSNEPSRSYNPTFSEANRN